ncbi:MAG TPA: hypothetical protein VFP56_04280 [Candidatus Limnocylindrales bacterium]|nr:hypothetical protein [Candidatus Limnocylindrales bacterium]
MQALRGIVVAAIVVAGCGGAAGTTAPGTTTPTAAAAATPATTPAARPTAAPTSACGPVLRMTDLLPAGSYCIDSRLGVAIDVPEGWGTCCGGVILKDDFTGLLYADVTQVVVYHDACLWSSGQTEPEGAAAIAAALSKQRPREGSAPRDVTVAGLPGYHVRLTVPADQPVTGGSDQNFTGCDAGQFRSFKAGIDGLRYHQGPSQVDDFYLVDIGASTVVFDVVTGPQITAAEQAELDGMLASLEVR